MKELKDILQAAIRKSDLQPRKFATAKKICLGLESSLRNINNEKSSCVFISLSIKPNHVVSLIARNAEIKDETQPVFAQPKLENFIEELFGIKALCMVLPKDLINISKALNDWVENKRKPKKPIAITTIPNKKPILKKKPRLCKIEHEIEVEGDKKPEKENPNKSWSGDYISFGKRCQVVEPRLNDDQVVDALTEIMDKIPTASLKPKQNDNAEPMEVECERVAAVAKPKEVCRDENASDNSDDFLKTSEYQALTVHKIKGNSNKSERKKRKKNKKKNLNK